MAQTVGNVVGMAGGVWKHHEGKRMQREAKKFMDAFEWQDLSNVADGLQVSTLGSDIMREDIARSSATATEALRGSGTRGVLGGLGMTQMQTNKANLQVAADLDSKQKEIQQIRAKDDAIIRAMVEKRQADELAGYGNMFDVGMAMKFGGGADVQASWQAQGQHEQETFQLISNNMQMLG